MRQGLAGLTIRGRALLAAGLTAICCAVLLGQTSLVRVGTLIAVLPLLAAWWVGRQRPDLEIRRWVTPPVLSTGQRAEVRVEVHNRGSRRVRDTLWSEHLGYALGDRPRILVEPVEPGGHRSAAYPITAHTRGRHPLGPATLRIRDPFGLVEIGRTYGSAGSLYVTPRVIPLPVTEFHLAGTDRGSHHAFAAHSVGGEDVLLREYQHGDDLRRVHWPSSARTGRLVVRREEQTLRRTATVLIDNRCGVPGGHDSPASLEAAVTSAASVAIHLVEQGLAVRLVAADGSAHDGRPRGRTADSQTRPILEWLAELGASQTPRWDLHAVRSGGHRGPGAAGGLNGTGELGLVVGLFARPAAQDAALCDLVGTRASLAWGLLHLPDPSAGGPQPTDPTGSDVLSAAGWRVSGLGPGDSLPTVWRSAWRHPSLRGSR